MDFKILLGRRIKSLRQGTELTQEELAEKMGISSKYLSSIERGLENPTLDTLINMSTALDVEVGDIFEVAHETENVKELRQELARIGKEADENHLRLGIKILRAITK